MTNTETSVAERLAELVSFYEKGNKAAFARAIGITAQGVGDLLKGEKGGPSFHVLQNILIKYAQVREEWLLFGRGSMLRSQIDSLTPSDIQIHASYMEEEQRPAYGKNVRVLTVQVDGKNNENIELVSSRAAAGYVAGGFLEPEFIGQLPSFNLPDPAFRNATFRAFQVSGDSMESTLYPGDWIICRYVEHWDRDIRDGYVHVVVTEDSLLVKRVLNRLNERGELTLQSDNTAIPTQFLDAQLVREVWVGVGRLSRKLINPRFDVNQELMRTRADVDDLLNRMERLEKGKRTN